MTCRSETHDAVVLIRLLFPHPAGWALHVNCAGSIALIEGLLLPLHLVSSASLLSRREMQCYCSLTVACTHTHIHRHTQITSHQYGRGQAILWEVTLQMSRQLQGHRTYFFPAGAFLMGCRGRQKHTGGRDKTAEQHIRIGIDNKPIIHDGRELTNTTRGRGVCQKILAWVYRSCRLRKIVVIYYGKLFKRLIKSAVNRQLTKWTSMGDFGLMFKALSTYKNNSGSIALYLVVSGHRWRWLS